jgi:pyruvate dehydrogenase E1 component alpha subunit
MTEIASFAVRHTRFLDADGRAVRPLPAFARDPAELIRLYRAMVLTRSFDAKAVALQRTGRLGTFASSLGQEAVMAGTGAAMRPEDVLLPSFREQGAQFLRGAAMTDLLLYWGGDERGSDFAGPREDFPICVPVGTHAAHAAGVALAFQLRGEARVAVCVFGDGATSKGEVYEAMNLAGVWRLPVVFVVNNNHWAISVPRARQTAARTLAQKAIACGFDGVQVDGNDVIAVRDAVARALEQARAGGGPGLVEAVTYRLSDHTTVDDASRYRDDAEVSLHWKEEPILRLRKYLTELGAWSKADEERLIADCGEAVEAAAEAYLATPPQAVESMFDWLYAELPDDLAEQRAGATAEAAAAGGEDDG